MPHRLSLILVMAVVVASAASAGADLYVGTIGNNITSYTNAGPPSPPPLHHPITVLFQSGRGRKSMRFE